MQPTINESYDFNVELSQLEVRIIYVYSCISLSRIKFLKMEVARD